MNGRTTVLILFFWAVLTIVTPILVRLSASAAKPAMWDDRRNKGWTKDVVTQKSACSHSTTTATASASCTDNGTRNGTAVWNQEGEKS
ncbi:hypothetical protein C3L33_11063, partial [Rhododendron williamsianum]